jgi:hypothetical protein
MTIKNKEKGMVLKLDYEKAYDRVDWQFLQEMLLSRGFDGKWVNWIMRMVKGGSICVSLNDENNPFLALVKG